jgi:hypothetical protein
MATREDLESWLQTALRALGGKGPVVEICKKIRKPRKPNFANRATYFMRGSIMFLGPRIALGEEK